MGSGATNVLQWSAASGSDRVEASPVIGPDGTVYIGADDGKVYAFNGATGSIRWAVAVQPQGVDSTAAIGADGSVYVGAGKSLVALDAATGTEKWRFATNGDVESSPTIAPDGTLYVGADDSRVYALDSSNGALKWYFVFPDDSNTDSSPALGADGTVYIGSDKGTLYALDGKTGTLNWSFAAVGEISGAPALSSDGAVYFSALNSAKTEARTYALDGASGRQKWVKSLPSDSKVSVALGADGSIFASGVKLPIVPIVPGAGSAVSQAVVWALDGKTGEQKWERLLEPGAQGVTAPSLGADGTVYVHAEKPVAPGGFGMLSALDPLTGAVKWEFATNGSSNSSPAIGADGTVYVGSDDGKVYAIR
jgi:outer membrane protein assembly factor BamB